MKNGVGKNIKQDFCQALFRGCITIHSDDGIPITGSIPCLEHQQEGENLLAAMKMKSFLPTPSVYYQQQERKREFTSYCHSFFFSILCNKSFHIG
jgi:hypothetical protein